MDIRPCVIEFQAFRNNNDKFIIKELVILDLLTYVVYPFMFEAPFPFNCLNTKAKLTNKWITNYFHHIDWNEGFVSYTNVHRIMSRFCKHFTHIYTRGLEKKNWIQQYTNNAIVYDITVDRNFDINYKNICIFANDHKHMQSQCALQNAYRLAAYVKQTHGGGGGNGGYEWPAHPQYHQYCSRLEGGNIYYGNTATTATSNY